MAFSKNSIEFIVKAAKQKNPAWLDKNRKEFEKVLVDPMRDLMNAAKKALADQAPGYRFPRGNFARIKRHSGLAKNKGPFRDWVSISVSKDSGSRYDSLPNLYFHIDEDDVLSAGGLYMPSAKQTKHIRKWIDQDPFALEELLEDKKFKTRFKELGTERVLKTKPRDYPLDHPKIEWLKLSGWYVWRPFAKKVFYSKDFKDILIEDWRQILRLNRILDTYISTWPKDGFFDTLKHINTKQSVYPPSN